MQINSITIAPETQKKQEFRMADIEELDQDEEENDPLWTSMKKQMLTPYGQ